MVVWRRCIKSIFSLEIRDFDTFCVCVSHFNARTLWTVLQQDCSYICPVSTFSAWPDNLGAVGGGGSGAESCGGLQRHRGGEDRHHGESVFINRRTLWSVCHFTQLSCTLLCCSNMKQTAGGDAHRPHASATLDWGPNVWRMAGGAGGTQTYFTCARMVRKAGLV